MNETNVHVSSDASSPSSRKGNLSFIFLAIAVFLGGIVFIPIAGLSTELVKTTFISVFTILSLVFFSIPVLKKGVISLPKGIIFYSLGLSVLITTLSSLFSGIFRYSFWGYGTEAYTAGIILISFTVFILTFNLFDSEKRIAKAWTYTGVMAGAVALIAIIYYVLALLGVVSNTWSPVGFHADSALLIGLMLIILSIGLQFFNLSKLHKIIGYVVFGVTLLFLGLTVLPFSFFWILMAVMSAILFTVSLLNFNKLHGSNAFSSKSAASIPFIILFVISVLFIVIPGTIYNIAPSFIASSVGSNVGADWITTKDLAINTVKHDPLLGPGPNLFVKNYWNNRPDSINQGIFWNTSPYNGKGAIQTLMVSSGILGMISWLILIVSLFIAGIKSVISARHDIKWSKLLSGVSILYISIVLVNYSISVFLMVFSFFLIALYLSNKNLEKNHSHHVGTGATGKILSIALSVILLVAGLAYIYGIGIRVLAQNKLISASNLIAENKIDEAELKVLDAAKLTDMDSYYKALFSLEVGKVSNLLNSTPEDAANDKEWNDKLTASFQNAVLAGNSMVASFPDSNPNVLSLANFYSDSAAIKVPGAFDRAKEVYTALITKTPNDPSVYYFLAKLEFANGDIDSAILNLSKALELKGDVIDFSLGLADAYIAKKDFTKATDVLLAASQKIAPAESQMLYDKLALVLFGTKQYEKAIPVFARILQLPPQVQNYSYANVKYYLGLSLIKTGDYDNALIMFNDIKTTNPENTDLDRIITSVKAKKDPFPDFVPEVKQATTTKPAASTKAR